MSYDLPRPPEWMNEANCAGTDPEIFFIPKGGSPREALSVCRMCTVQAECLEFALESGDRFGIWGGLSERRRHQLLRPTDTGDAA